MAGAQRRRSRLFQQTVIGDALKPLPVKLIFGLISGHTALFEKTERLLCARFGPHDFSSPILDFDKTDHYRREMGEGLKRKFLSFEKLMRPERLVAVKRSSLALEKKLMDGAHRTVNIDPGYLTLSKLVLASTKNFCHRIYAGSGIFEEITLFYKDRTFQPGPWTYPDFRSPDHINIFNQIRDIYLSQMETRYGLSSLSRCV